MPSFNTYVAHDVHGGERGGEVDDSLLGMWGLVSLLGAQRLAQVPRHFRQLFICKKVYNVYT